MAEGESQDMWMRRDFRRELRELRGHRATVIWHCNGAIACSTGRIVEVGADYVEVRGPVPTFAEHLAKQDCDDLAAVELEILIPLVHVCAVVEDVPECRRAGPPLCCFGDGFGVGPARP